MPTKTINPKDILTTPQACRILGVARQTLYIWMEQGRIKPWMKVGGASWLFRKEDIEKLKPTRYQRVNGHKYPSKKLRR